MNRIAVAGLILSIIFLLFYGDIVNMIYPCPPYPMTMPCNFGRTLIPFTVATFFGLMCAIYLAYVHIRNKNKLK